MPNHLGSDNAVDEQDHRAAGILIGAPGHAARGLNIARRWHSSLVAAGALSFAACAFVLVAAACGGSQPRSDCTAEARTEIAATADSIGQPEAAIVASRREWSCEETSQGHALDLVFNFEGPADVVLTHYDSRLRQLGWHLLGQDMTSGTWSKTVQRRTSLVLNVHKSLGDDSYTVSIAEQQMT